MRGDVEKKQNFNTLGARSNSENEEKGTCMGFNILKLARYMNIIGATALIIVCVLEIIDIFSLLSNIFTGLGGIILNIFFM